MAPSTQFSCSACAAVSPKWAGRCGACGAWNTMVEHRDLARTTSASVCSLDSVSLRDGEPRPTGIAEFDRLFGGGLVAGSVTLLYGEPGAGKSTLLSQVATAAAQSGQEVLLVCAEESAAQVRQRAERLGSIPGSLKVVATTSVEAALRAMDETGASLVIVDSIQAISSTEERAGAGAVSQIRACTERLVAAAKAAGPAIVLVGHVTKDGDLAGPRSLEHLVDTVVAFEGDRHQSLRVARALKHRFGTTGEVGLFEMGAGGLVGVTDPGRLLLDDHVHEVPGSALGVIVEGHRPLICELQTLVVDAHGERPRRTPQGIDAARLSLLIAVLEARCHRSLAGTDVFASCTGGLRATEPATDLPLALALVAGLEGVALPQGLCAFGEVGLAGELRRVTGAERRIAEAARLGLSTVIVPHGTPPLDTEIAVLRASSLLEAVELAASLVPTVAQVAA